MLMVLAVSLEMDAKEREVITREMIRGFNDTAEEAGTVITGGQSILNPWPIIGGVANSVVKTGILNFLNLFR
jgi:selenide,water dikinase